MNPDRQPTCEERIDEQLKDRIDTIRQLWEADKNGEDEVEDLGSFNEYGLCFDYVRPGTFGDEQREGYFRYQLGCGGPADEFRYFVSGPDFCVHRIEYRFMDWYAGAKRELGGDDEELMSEIFDYFNECGTVQHQYEKVT